MAYRIEYNEEKNILLKEIRKINFEDIVRVISVKGIIDDLKHHDQKRHPGQRVLAVRVRNYIYAVPYVIDKKRKVIFLKTVYPSRVLTKKYLKKRGDSNDKK